MRRVAVCLCLVPLFRPVDDLTSLGPVCLPLPWLAPTAGCNLSGEDLNRHWTSPVKGGTPTVWYTKRLLSICRRRRVAVFCDFHGHSRKKNIFMFGCEHSDGTPERVFPRLLDRCAPDFSYKCVHVWPPALLLPLLPCLPSYATATCSPGDPCDACVWCSTTQELQLLGAKVQGQLCTCGSVA